MDTLSVKPSQVSTIALRAMMANRPLFIWGPPGIGKSELVYGEIMSFDQILKEVSEVNSAGIRALADEILHAAPTLAVVGPFSKRSVFDRVMK